MTRAMRIAAFVIGIVLFSGVVWGVVGIAQNWLSNGQLLDAVWWQFLLAIPIIGVAALAFEALGLAIGHAFGVNKPDTPKWKEYLGVFAIIGAVIAILIVFNVARP